MGLGHTAQFSLMMFHYPTSAASSTGSFQPENPACCSQLRTSLIMFWNCFRISTVLSSKALANKRPWMGKSQGICWVCFALWPLWDTFNDSGFLQMFSGNNSGTKWTQVSSRHTWLYSWTGSKSLVPSRVVILKHFSRKTRGGSCQAFAPAFMESLNKSQLILAESYTTGSCVALGKCGCFSPSPLTAWDPDRCSNPALRKGGGIKRNHCRCDVYPLEMGRFRQPAYILVEICSPPTARIWDALSLKVLFIVASSLAFTCHVPKHGSRIGNTIPGQGLLILCRLLFHLYSLLHTKPTKKNEKSQCGHHPSRKTHHFSEY